MYQRANIAVANKLKSDSGKYVVLQMLSSLVVMPNVNKSCGKISGSTR